MYNCIFKTMLNAKKKSEFPLSFRVTAGKVVKRGR